MGSVCSNTLLEQLQTLQNKAARTIASLRYEDANPCQLISQYGWLNVEHLIYYDLGVFMYKTTNGLSPAISSLQNIKDIHQYQTRSAKMEIFTFQMLTLWQARGLSLLLVLNYGMKYQLKLEMQSLLILSVQSSKLSIYQNNKYDMIHKISFLYPLSRTVRL